MEIRICDSAIKLGFSAAEFVAGLLNENISRKGKSRILLSTGASQFNTLEALRHKSVDWSKVEMFHLDEYIGLDETHSASFRKYLKERFIQHIDLGKYHLIDGCVESIGFLNQEISREAIDIGLIGIGENAHIAFNDPPADFDCEEPYKVVVLDETCKRQQVREGWFANEAEVPPKAISMSVQQIMKCKVIVSCVPYKVKSQAVYDTLKNGTTNLIPATILKTHEKFIMYTDRDSSEKILKI